MPLRLFAFQRLCAGAALLVFAVALTLPTHADTPEVDVDDDKLEVTLWATADQIGSPVAIDFDHDGHAYLTQTRRRRASDLDIRHFPRLWWDIDLSFESLADREAFYRDELAPANSDRHPQVADHNQDGSRDYRDLMVQKEIVYRLTDTDGDGTADRVLTYVENFNDLLSGVAGGVLAHNGDVFLGVAPDFWRLTDTTGDGQADEKQSLVHGYGVHIALAGHGMSGVTLGPDGRIYWAIGDIGFDIEGPDGTRHHHPHEGAVFRINPDGSDFEVVATGLRNTHELAFDKHGSLIAVDNQPGGQRTRILELVDGSDTGWRIHYQYILDRTPWHPWYEEDYGIMDPDPDHAPAFITQPIGHLQPGPAGLVYNPGAALSERWQDTFFNTSFQGGPAQSGIVAFRLEPHGASFRRAEAFDVLQGILGTGLAFSPEGALYMADWVAGWVPDDNGRVWRIDDAQGRTWDLRHETAALLAEGMSERPIDELRDLLAHDDQRVRLEAQFELVDRGGDGQHALIDVAEAHENRLARLHAVWGLGQLGRADAAAAQPLVELLSDDDAIVCGQAAKTLGQTQYQAAAEPIAELLTDPEPRVRMFAGIAVGRFGYAEALPQVIEMLAENDDEDQFLRHAGVMALLGIGDEQAVLDLASHDSPAVRAAAVVVLRRMEHPGVAQFLADGERRVVLEAARAIHDDGGTAEARPALADLLADPPFHHEPLIRRAIAANLRLGDASHAANLLVYAANPDAPDATRIEALRTVRLWIDPPLLDRVTGFYQDLEPRDAEHLRAALEVSGRLDRLVAGSDAVQAAVFDALAQLEHPGVADAAAEALDDQSRSPGVHISALHVLHEAGDDRLGAAVESALASDNEDLRNTARDMLAAALDTADAGIDLLTEALEHGTVGDQQGVLRTLGRMDSDAAEDVLLAWMDRLIVGDGVPAALQLDLLQAAEAHGSDALRNRRAAYEDARPADDPLADWLETLEGGDAGAGRDIVLNHAAANCLECHQVEGAGGTMGPPLESFGAERDRRFILQSLVRPNDNVAPGYGSISLTLDNGSSLNGTLLEETAEVLIVEVGGESREIPLDRIETRNGPFSPMPPMGGILDKEDLRDVVEYLNSLE